MPFNSTLYFLFLPVVFLLFNLAGERTRWCVLLAGSLLFYSGLNVPYLLVVLTLVTTTTYAFGIWLDHVHTSKAKLAILWGGIASNVLILVVMKYLPFLSENLRALSIMLSLHTQVHQAKTLVAIGISYYVFQAISYLFDIYLEIEKPERHFGYFALYLAFFPKLLQGPIERASDLIPQLKQAHKFDYDMVCSGVSLIAWGLFKKIVVADRLALLVNPVYDNVHAFKGLPLVLSTYFYSLQIYCDFSGYTDMALGTGLIFGIKLTQNFNNPYFATSISDFWRRWHISFSRWILDYIFKPLQMSFRNMGRWGAAIALIITFTVSGIWHGANWTFIVWGILHGLYLSAGVFYRPLQKKWYKKIGLYNSKYIKIWQAFFIFNLVSFTWIFFRAASISDALYVIANLFDGFSASSMAWKPNSSVGLGFTDLCVITISLIFIAVVNIFHDNDINNFINKKPTIQKYFFANVVIWGIVVFGIFDNNSFIYFKF